MGNVITVYVLLGGWVLLERNKGGDHTGILPFFLICALSAFKCAIFLLDNATAITNLLSTCVGVVIALFFCKAFIEEKRSSSRGLSGRKFAPPTPTPVDVKHQQYLKRLEEQAKEDEQRRNELYWAARIQREREDADFHAREEAERKEEQRQARRRQEEEAERRRQKEEADFERRQREEEGEIAFQRRQRAEKEQGEAFQRRQRAEEDEIANQGRQREEEDEIAFQRRQRAEKEQVEKKKSAWF